VGAGLVSGVGFYWLTPGPALPDHPVLTILDRPNVIGTPHTAWASDEAMQTLWDQVIFHIDNFKAGTPSNSLI